MVRRNPQAGTAFAPAVPRQARSRSNGRSVRATAAASSEAPTPRRWCEGATAPPRNAASTYSCTGSVSVAKPTTPPTVAGHPQRARPLVGTRHLEEEHVTGVPGDGDVLERGVADGGEVRGERRVEIVRGEILDPRGNRHIRQIRRAVHR